MERTLVAACSARHGLSDDTQRTAAAVSWKRGGNGRVRSNKV